jgi:hypothetical protein
MVSVPWWLLAALLVFATSATVLCMRALSMAERAIDGWEQSLDREARLHGRDEL